MISPNWLVGADTEAEKARRVQLVEHGGAFLDLLTALAESELNKLTSGPLAEYNSPNWAYLQADKQGQARVWKNILVLCNHSEGT